MGKEENTKILIIAEHESVRESITAYFSQAAYRVSSASDPTDAIDKLHSFIPELILCEITQGGAITLDVIEEIFSAVATQPLIALAGKENTQGILDAMNLGASDYFITPIAEMAILELTVKNNLKRARIIKENQTYRKNLEESNNELAATLELFESDQQAGRHVQVSLLPEPGQDIGAYHFNHRVLPSLYLSGDSVDYKPVSKHKVLFYIADVSGHGSSSAFLTILLRFRIDQLRREYFLGRFSEEFSPASILSALNKDLLDSGLDKHVTLFVGLLDYSEKELCYSVAGHHPLPIHYSNGKADFIKIAKSSFPIGLLEEAEYFNETIAHEEDFVLTLFSDGILEILDNKNMIEKEAFLLQSIVKAKGDFNSIKSNLGLDSIGNVPDDIAIMSVSKT